MDRRDAPRRRQRQARPHPRPHPRRPPLRSTPSRPLRSYLFWQRYHDSAEGKKFCTYYRTAALPHIAIIDPVTGASVKQWSGFKDDVYEPDPLAAATYEELFVLYSKLHDTFGGVASVDLGSVMKDLIAIRERVRKG